MKRFAIVAIVIGATLMSASAQLKISLGIRETGSTAAIGENGGSGGSIEWVDIDNQELTLDGTWQRFVFDLDALPLTPFTGDGVLDGAAGTIEHIRIAASNTAVGPYQIFIDDLVNTVDGTTDTPIGGGFEGFALGDEVLFQEPGFSGSTSGKIVAGATSGVSDAMAFSGTQSYEVNFEFVDGSGFDPNSSLGTNWVRLTTFAAANLPNPTIAFDRDSVVSFWAKGIPEPSTAVLVALAGVALIRRR